MTLEGIAAIVTGAGGVVGHAIAYALASEGANVAVVTLSSAQSDIVKKIKELGSQAIALHCDITDKNSVNQMVAQTVQSFGKIDLLVNNAGMSDRAPLEQLSVDSWDKVIAVNLKGVFLCSVAAAKEMMKQQKGNIVNITGASAHQCGAEMGAFGPSKAAVVNLTRQMAVEWAKYSIRVNGVSPGPIMDPVTAERIKEEGMRERIEKIPLGRVSKPEEIANVVLFLASEQSSNITGQTIIADGGGILTWYLYP